ncbi:MAG TPA: carboxypeptidase-like regulatory domain-containing protein, partial [Planctomycetota bacterium]|nr:carboxypeptidase-like regulatory domain-containing protein [Planctomycetota bacterium]
GEPVPRAEIRLQKGEEPIPPGPPAGIAREDGTFEVRAPAPGSYALWASAPGFLDGRAGPVEAKEGGTIEGIAVNLYSVGRTAGTLTILDTDGAPLAGVAVEATSTGFALGTPVRTVSGPDGRARFEALNAGATSFRLRLRGEGASEESVVESQTSKPLKSEEEFNVEMRIGRPSLSFEGKARDASGAPIAKGRAVAVFEPELTERFTFSGGSAPVGPDGTFRVPGLVSGVYRLRIFGVPPAGGPERLLVERAEMRPGGPAIDLVVAPDLPTLVEGTCLDLDSGRPLVASEARLEIGGKTVATDKTDAEGRFSFAALLSKDLPNILRVTHRRFGFEERWLRPEEVRPDGRYPELAFTASRKKPEDVR